MYFVESGREKDEAERPHARLDQIGLFLSQTAIREERQQRILRYMGKFANDIMPGLELLKLEPRKEECQKRKKDLRSVRG